MLWFLVPGSLVSWFSGSSAMPTQSRWYIRTALLHLLAAFAVGALVLVNQAITIDPRIATLTPVFYHLLTIGWITQLICGVALWMFPVLSREHPRGNERLGWLAYGGLNGGLLLRVLFEPLPAWFPDAPGWPLAVSAILQAAAIWCFVIAIWPRVRTRPTLSRE
jgi:hypothetical protein